MFGPYPATDGRASSSRRRMIPIEEIRVQAGLPVRSDDRIELVFVLVASISLIRDILRFFASASRYFFSDSGPSFAPSQDLCPTQGISRSLLRSLKSMTSCKV